MQRDSFATGPLRGTRLMLMTIDPTLLQILACPENKSPVTVAPEKIVSSINSKIESGKILNRAGQLVTTKIDGGLIRDDGKFLYPVRDNIPIMLIDEAIPLEGT